MDFPAFGNAWHIYLSGCACDEYRLSCFISYIINPPLNLFLYIDQVLIFLTRISIFLLFNYPARNANPSFTVSHKSITRFSWHIVLN